MSTLEKVYQRLQDLFIGQQIEAVSWHEKWGSPVFSLANGSAVAVRVYVSTSDMDLACVIQHNEESSYFWIDYGDAFGDTLPQLVNGTQGSTIDKFRHCVGQTVEAVQLKGTGQELAIRLLVSNKSTIEYHSSYRSTDLSIVVY